MSTMLTQLEAQRTAFMAELPVPIAARKDRLRRAAAMIRDNAPRFCDALSEDFGHRSRDQSMLTDIGGSIAPIAHALKHLDAWAKRERRAVQFPLGLLGARAWIEYQPKGVVGVIAPWNFPVNLVMSPLAGIFAAGNRAMVKTSEFTTATAALPARAAKMTVLLVDDAMRWWRQSRSSSLTPVLARVWASTRLTMTAQ